MEVERQRLYDQGAAWEEIIPNLSSARVQEEEQTREVLATFAPKELATPEERRELLALWNRKPASKGRPARRRSPKRRSP